MEEHQQYYQTASSSSENPSSASIGLHPSQSHKQSSSSSQNQHHPFAHPSSSSSRHYQQQQQQGRETHPNHPQPQSQPPTPTSQLPPTFNTATNPSSNASISSPSLSQRGSQSQSPSLSHPVYHHQQQQPRNNSIPATHPPNPDFYPHHPQRSNSYSHSNYNHSHSSPVNQHVNSPRSAAVPTATSAGAEMRPSPRMAHQQPNVTSSSHLSNSGPHEGRYPSSVTGSANGNGGDSLNRVRAGSALHSEMTGPLTRQDGGGSRGGAGGQTSHDLASNGTSYRTSSAAGGFELHAGGPSSSAAGFPSAPEAASMSTSNHNAGGYYAHQPPSIYNSQAFSYQAHPSHQQHQAHEIYTPASASAGSHPNNLSYPYTNHSGQPSPSATTSSVRHPNQLLPPTPTQSEPTGQPNEPPDPPRGIKRKSSASQDSHPHSHPHPAQPGPDGSMAPMTHPHPHSHLQHHPGYHYPDPVSSSAMSAYGHHPTASYSSGMYSQSHMYPNGTLASPSSHGMPTSAYPYGASYGYPPNDQYAQPQGIPGSLGVGGPGQSSLSQSQTQRSNSISSGSENGSMVQQQQQQIPSPSAHNPQYNYHPYGGGSNYQPLPGNPQDMRYPPQNLHLHPHAAPHPDSHALHPHHQHPHFLPSQAHYGYPHHLAHGNVPPPLPHTSSGMPGSSFYPSQQQQTHGGRSGSMSGKPLNPSSTAAQPQSSANSSSHPKNSTPASADNDKKPKKKSPPPAPAPKLPTKSALNPPKKSPSAWQLYFADDLAEYKKTMTRDDKLNVAQVAKEAAVRYKSISAESRESYKTKAEELKRLWEKEMNDWRETLSPKDIAQENLFRSAQRKAGKSRKSNIKDPNAPPKPLSAYFLYLREIRASKKMQEDIFSDETETTKQSVLAAERWRSMTQEEKNPYLAQAEKDKITYDLTRRQYEIEKGLIDPNTPLPVKRKRTHTHLNASAGLSDLIHKKDGSLDSTTSAGEGSGSGSGPMDSGTTDLMTKTEEGLAASPGELEDDQDASPEVADLSADFANEDGQMDLEAFIGGNGDDHEDLNAMMKAPEAREKNVKIEGQEESKKFAGKEPDSPSRIGSSEPQSDSQSESQKPQARSHLPTDGVTHDSASKDQSETDPEIQFSSHDFGVDSINQNQSNDGADGVQDESLNLDFDPNSHEIDIGKMAMEMNVDGMTFDLSSIQPSNQERDSRDEPDTDHHHHQHDLMENEGGAFKSGPDQDFLSNLDPHSTSTQTGSLDTNSTEEGEAQNSESSINANAVDKELQQQQNKSFTLNQKADDSGNLISSS